MRTQLWKCFGNTSGVSLYSCSCWSLKLRRPVPALPRACPVSLEKSPLSLSLRSPRAGHPSPAQGLVTGMKTQQSQGCASSYEQLVHACVSAYVCECICVYACVHVGIHVCVRACVCGGEGDIVWLCAVELSSLGLLQTVYDVPLR